MTPLPAAKEIELSEEGEFHQAGDASATPVSPSAACIMITACLSRSSSGRWRDNIRFGGALMAVKIAEKAD